MKFRFAAQRSWKYMGVLWFLVAVMILWLGAARVQAFGFSWLEFLAFATSLLGLGLALYFWNMKRIVLFATDASGISAHKGLGSSRRKLLWKDVSHILWEDSKCVFIKHDGSGESWDYSLMEDGKYELLKQELAKYKPLYEKPS